MIWTDWLAECVQEQVSSTFCGRVIQYSYTPPANGDAHALSVIFGQLYISEAVAVELVRLAVARTQAVNRDKVKAAPFTERVGTGPVIRGWLFSWNSADMRPCRDCWYIVNQIRCDHPFLRTHINGDLQTRSTLAEAAWAHCQGDLFRDRKASPLITTVEEVFA